MNSAAQDIGTVAGLGCLLAVVIFMFPLIVEGKRDTSAIESITGVPFVEGADGTQIIEPLAHADVYLKEPVLAKELLLAVTFNPGNAREIYVGVRENGFWLSYDRLLMWDNTMPRSTQTRFIQIPLTDKFQEPDRSIDVMFFANTEKQETNIAPSPDDTIHWSIISLVAETNRQGPALSELKNYIRSVVSQERAQ